MGESLAQQVGPLDIHVTNIEPGGFRTEWAGASATFADTRLDDYRPTVGEHIENTQRSSGQQTGDPRRAAQVLYEVVRQQNPPLHLPLASWPARSSPG